MKTLLVYKRRSGYHKMNIYSRLTESGLLLFDSCQIVERSLWAPSRITKEQNKYYMKKNMITSLQSSSLPPSTILLYIITITINIITTSTGTLFNTSTRNKNTNLFLLSTNKDCIGKHVGRLGSSYRFYFA